MAYHFTVAAHGKTLATRPLGEALRDEVIHCAGEEDSLVLDFTGINGTSHSFADEFIAQLAEEARDGKVDFEITITGASPEVERVLRRALERRGVDLPALV